MVAMVQTHKASYPDELENPKCLRCDEAMRLIRTDEEYPGYHRRVFECSACEGTMTEWTGLVRAQ